ncbi:MAG: TAT-variant-translocated molybdopterin oxidoreductase [Melioribacteraceae bacterium]|nr:TAT-variant-translocated molybdopterin oxidoreductase [Melioribacteraceae bacterium]
MSKSRNETKYWKNLKEYYNDPDVFEEKINEFKDGVTDDFETSHLSSISRRKFLTLMAASAAFSATACTDYRDKGEIVPYTRRPEDLVPGIANYYATSLDGYTGNGVLVKTREGRPIKIDGNPEHPINKGKIDAAQQASILNLYDPDRLGEPQQNKKQISWNKAINSISGELKKAAEQNKKIALISNRITSPTTNSLIEKLKEKYSNIEVYSYELFDDTSKRNAWNKSYSGSLIPSVKLNEAEIILSIGNDFLAKDGNVVENIKQFSSRKEFVKEVNSNRLYVVESELSLTGSNADYRFPLKNSDQKKFLLTLLNGLVSKDAGLGSQFPIGFKTLIAKHDFAALSNIDKKNFDQLVNDLLENTGKSILVVDERASEEIQILSHLVNEILNNNDLLCFSKAFVDYNSLSNSDELKNLVNELNSGNISVIINLDSNPVYHLSYIDGFAEAFNKTAAKISLSQFENETTALSNYVIPINNPLESWGDFYVRKNVYTLQQPIIAPLRSTIQKETFLLSLLNEKLSSDSEILPLVKENFKKLVYEKNGAIVSFDNYWNNSLHDGFAVIKIEEEAKADFNYAVLENISFGKSAGGLTLLLKPNHFIGDSRFANNGWLQEIPHPVSKVAWDNYAAVSPNTADKYQLVNNDVVEIKSGAKAVKIPILVQPGTTDDTFVVELGYGRTNSGDVVKDVGFNLNNMISLDSDSPYSISGISVSKTGETYELVSTQEHHAVDDSKLKDIHLSRGIIREGTITEYKKNPDFVHEHDHPIFSITDEHEYKDHKWAMAIDLNKCIGCSYCVASCNVENNIPVVGKDQVGVGREMHWMRIDRYYSGSPDNPEVSTQPMICQHCDNAPCENVCPVNATNHSPDGLNQMAYNRCVGTRYCANNCPYKVRRFNFFDFRDNFADAFYENDSTALVHNPEVTVRSRGVMEKCTFCIQRIMDARSKAIAEGREVAANEIKTACQQSCPADAIVFGDSNNKESEVNVFREHKLGYHVLEEINVKPNVTYIAKLRNTESEDV